MNTYAALANQKILVTGAGGFIGTPLCRRLVKLQTEMHAISRTQLHAPAPNIFWHTGDLADYTFVSEIVREIKPDFVVHLASHVLGSRELKYVLSTFHSNLTSTVNLLTAVAETGCKKIILAGSLEEPALQNGLAIPSSPYAAAKWAASGYGRLFHVLYQTPVILARIFMVYGPGQNDLKKIIPYTILSLLKGQTPQFSSASRLVDWIFIDDVVDGLLSILATPDLAGQQIDLGSGSLTSIRKVIEQLFEILNSPQPPQFGGMKNRPMEQVRTANLSATQSRINWQPEYSLKRGLELTVDWYNNLYHETLT